MDIRFNEIELDRLTPQELRTLDQSRHISILDELLGEIKTMGELKCDLIEELAAAKMYLIKCTEANKDNAKADVIDKRCNVDKITIMIQARKQQSSIIQTLLRSIPA